MRFDRIGVYVSARFIVFSKIIVKKLPIQP